MPTPPGGPGLIHAERTVMDINALRGYEVPPERYVPKFANNRDAAEPFAMLR